MLVWVGLRRNSGKNRQTCRICGNAMLTDNLLNQTHLLLEMNQNILPYLATIMLWWGASLNKKCECITSWPATTRNALLVTLSHFLPSGSVLQHSGVQTPNLCKDIRLKRLNQSQRIRKCSWFSSNPGQLVTQHRGWKHPENSSASQEQKRESNVTFKLVRLL